MIRICHASDFHWRPLKYPWADLYVFTGDLLDDYPSIDPNNACFSWKNEPKVIRIKQKLGISKFLRGMGGMRPLLGNPDAPVVAVRGNHDFIDIAPLFEGCNFKHEFFDNEVVSVKVGDHLLSITGHRGVPSINGAWSDEMSRADLMDRVKRMTPDADLYLTHYPPAGILDSNHSGSSHYGLDGLANWLEYNTTKEHPVHCFGHVHQHGGNSMKPGKTLHSNAATTWNLIIGDPEKGWVDDPDTEKQFVDAY